MYTMMMSRNNLKEFGTIQSCISAMIENGYKCRSVSYIDGDNMYIQKITIDKENNVIVGKKKIEKVFD